MALQSLLNVYDKSNKSLNSSYLGKSNGFKIEIFKNDFWTFHSDEWTNKLPKVKEFSGIMLENLALNFQTSWGDAGGAVLGKKIDSYVNSKFIKMLAGQSDHGFMPFICSDAWTQQKVNGDAQPVKVQLKFKAYNTNRFGCTNYNDIIKFLIVISSPIKSSNAKYNRNGQGIGSDLGDTINNAVEGGSNVIGTIIESGKTFAQGFSNKQGENESNEQYIERKNSFAAAAKTLVETIDSTYNKLVQTTGKGKNNGNFTVLFSLGGIDNQNKNSAKIIKRTYNEASPLDIDWIITNFSFKPSRQFQMVNGVPKPLWIDFDVSLETRLSLSNRYVYNVLIPKALTIKEESKK